MRHQAIILKKVPLKEDDELIMCYTRDFGKQRYRAKSSTLAHSKQGTHLDILNHVEFSLVEGKHSSIIASANSVNAFPGIKTSLAALSAAFVLVECFDKLVFEGQEDLQLWNILREELHRLDRGDVEPRTMQSRILKVMGHHVSDHVQDLAQSRFTSLQFFRNVIR